jgi:prepilin-type N-terminal cleavage/methylation domain-containing protein
MVNKFFTQKGVSLAEMLVAIVVSTIVFAATYAIYSNFQKTFVRQINFNNLKQEARFALHALQHDSKMAGFKHEKTYNGEVQMPVKVLNDDGTEVTDDTEFGEKVFFCFDTVDNSGNIIQRKLIQYELKIPHSPLTEKTVLKKKIWNTTNCDIDDTVNTTVDVDWMPVAQFFNEFKIRLRSKHIDFEVILETVDREIRETYTASSFMRNLNFGGKTFYVSDEENLHENRPNVIPFTGSLKAQCSNNIKLDIQTPSFQTEDSLIILHQGETVGGPRPSRTHDGIKFESQKPPEIIGLPGIGHNQMRLRLDSLTTNNNLPPGLKIFSAEAENTNLKERQDIWDADNADDTITTTTTKEAIYDENGFSTGEYTTKTTTTTTSETEAEKISRIGERPTEIEYGGSDGSDGSLTFEGTLESDDANYNFVNGFQDFTIRLKADLDTNCDSLGWVDQNEAYKEYTVRVMKYSAPQFADVNLHTWEPKGLMAGYHNYERHGWQNYWGGPDYDLSKDGRSFYLQQNISSPIFLVSKEDYDSFVLKGVVCSGAYPDCGAQMNDWMDDDMLGFAAGYQRPSVVQKKWPDGKIRACAGVDYKRNKNLPYFSKNSLSASLKWQERQEFNKLSETERDEFFGEPADNFFDMYLWTWWGMKYTYDNRWNNSSIQVHQYKELEFYHWYSCGFREGPYLNHMNLGHQIGWYPMPDWYITDRYKAGYNKLFNREDRTRPLNTGDRNCNYARGSFSRISYNPGATHRWGCGYGKNAGVKNIVTLTYHPNLFKANINNKPYKRNADSQSFTAFDLRFDDSGFLNDHTNSVWPHKETASPTNVFLPSAADASDDLKTENFQRFQKGAVAIATFSQPNNQYSNIQIARLPRYVPSRTALNKPMPKAQNLNFYLSEKFETVSKIYGLLSKSYDPAGNDIELLVSSNNCIKIRKKGTVETGAFKSQTVDGVARSMSCRLSGTWRAKTEQQAAKRDLPNINDMYDINKKAAYEGARASVVTTAGGIVHVFADGSFKYKVLPTGFDDKKPHEDSFYYAVQTSDTENSRVSDIKKVYIGYNIENTKPTDVSFNEVDGTLIIDELDLNLAEDARKDKVIGEIFTTPTQEPDQFDFVRINLGDVPKDDIEKDVDHISRFRIDQIDEKFYLVLNDSTNISWGSLPANKKYFSVRIIATDLRGNQLETTKKVYVDRVDCTETAMTNITVYRTRAAMTIEGYIHGKQGTSVFRRQTVPFTNNIDEAVINFDFEERDVQPSIKIYEQNITVDGVNQTIGMIANRCRESHDYVDVQQLWSDES